MSKFLHMFHTFAGLGSRMRARAVHRLLVVGAQYISFEAANLQLVYRQAGMPGPCPTPDSPLAGEDAICLDVRKISLAPQGSQSLPSSVAACSTFTRLSLAHRTPAVTHEQTPFLLQNLQRRKSISLVPQMAQLLTSKQTWKSGSSL